MANVEQYARELEEMSEMVSVFKSKFNSLCGGSFGWGVSQVVASYLSLFDRFCPFKVGDQVVLARDVVVDRESGWYSSRHFLVKGSKGEVRGRGYSDGMFCFNIVFDDESYIDDEHRKHIPVDKHMYKFSDRMLEKFISEKPFIYK